MLRASSVSRVLFNSRHNHARFRPRFVTVNFSEPRDLTAGIGDGEPMAESAERYISWVSFHVAAWDPKFVLSRKGYCGKHSHPLRIDLHARDGHVAGVAIDAVEAVQTALDAGKRVIKGEIDLGMCTSATTERDQGSCCLATS